MAKLIDGKVISAAVKAEVAEEVAKLLRYMLRTRKKLAKLPVWLHLNTPFPRIQPRKSF